MRRAGLAAIGALAVLACSGADEPHSATRVWEKGAWREVALPNVGPDVIDRPLSMAASHGAIYLFNAGTRSVIAFASDGHVLWRYTPDDSLKFETDTTVALTADASGRVLIADVSAGRITELSPLGTVERVFRIHDRLHLAERADRWFWGASLLGTAPALFDTAGHRYLSLRPPASMNEGGQYPRGDARLAFAHDTLVVAYMWGGHFLIVVGPTPIARDMQAIEPRPFGHFHQADVTVDSQTVQAFVADSTDHPATLSMAVDGGLIYALYWNGQGSADDRHRTLDIYDLSRATYLGSRRLPLACKEIAVSDGVLYGLGDDGALHAWRWSPSSSAKQ